MHSLMRRAWVDIDLGALLRNGTTIATQARKPLLPMVKADGYGLGAVRVARTLERLDPWGFGVATIAEGEELRGAAIERAGRNTGAVVPAHREARLVACAARAGAQRCSGMAAH